MGLPSFASVRADLGQTLVDRLGPGPWTGDCLEIHHAGWRLVLDSYHVPVESFEHTRMIITVPSFGFRFHIYEPHAFSWITTLFGLLDIEIGEQRFDDRWVIKSSSNSRIRELLADLDLRNQIDALQHCALSLEADLSRIDPDAPSSNRSAEPWDELVLVRAELPPSVDALRQMFEVLAATLERLEALAPGGS